MCDNKTDLKKDKIFACSNCGLMGHGFNKCKEPITSWGIILVRINDNIEDYTERNWDPIDINEFKNRDGIPLESKSDLKAICMAMDSIQFLLIRRKHSLGYTEFIRGRYVKDNIEGIIRLFQQMTPEEITYLETQDFDTLWTNFWSGDMKKQNLNKREFLESREQFEDLKNCKDVELGLDFYTKYAKPLYESPEWGFPKGRKARGESDLECAIREFCEETGYSVSDIKILNNVKPIIENIIGTNGVSYRHIYYLAEDLSRKDPEIDGNLEIGGIGFFNFDDVNKLLRSYHLEKKNIAKNIFMYYLELLTNKNKSNDKIWTTDIDDF